MLFTFSLLIRSAAERASLSSEDRVVFSRSALWWGESEVGCSQESEQHQIYLGGERGGNVDNGGSKENKR